VLWIDTGLDAQELEQVDEALGLNRVVRSVMDTCGVGLRFVDGAIRLTVAGWRHIRRQAAPRPSSSTSLRCPMAS
jgi:hypothetical protein